MPLSVERLLNAARHGEVLIAATASRLDGRAFHQPARRSGSGARAMSAAPWSMSWRRCPTSPITWVDTAPERFPKLPPASPFCPPPTRPMLVAACPDSSAQHLILTFSHALDLALCHALLAHGFGCARPDRIEVTKGHGFASALGISGTHR